MQPLKDLKDKIRDFWNTQSCGEVYAKGDDLRQQFEQQARLREILEPYLHDFANFPDARNHDVLEIGVGMGADHLQFARAGPKSLVGIDLTERAVGFSRSRLASYGFASNIFVGDAENIPFPDRTFDVVFSYGVLHHTPDTRKAISEVGRILRPGGVARIMIYHKHSIVGCMLWLRYGLFAGHPFRSLSDLYANYLESPGTKAFTISEVRAMFSGYSSVRTAVRLGLGDLLLGEAGQRHSGFLLQTARRIWPRWFIRRFLSNYGLGLMIEAVR